jgi:GNAT superfamily N-acetyltransferase
MTTFQIRMAELTDMAALGDVFRRSSLSNDRDRANLVAHPEVLELSDVAVRDGRTRAAVRGGVILGFATWLTADEAGDTIEVDDLFVDPDWMRRGVGRALMQDLVGIARSRGASRLEVTGNEHADAFYTSVGFVRDHDVQTRFGPAPRMHLDLESRPPG